MHINYSEVRHFHNLPPELVLHINTFLSYKCHVCCRKLVFSQVPIFQRFYFCSKQCYDFV